MQTDDVKKAELSTPAAQAKPWSQGKADRVIALIAILWGSSYLMMKVGLDGILPFTITALRFSIAFFCVGLLFFRQLKNTTKKILLQGSLMGFFLFAIFAFLMHGMTSTSASNAGFLISTAVVMVPVFHALLIRRLPDLPTLLGVTVTTVGLALLTVQSSFTLQSGDLLCIGGAAMYACQILLADHFTKDGNGLLLGIWQLGFCGLYAWLCAFLFETPVLPQSTAEWFAVLGLAVICSTFCFVALAVICSAFCFVAQPVAQKYTTPEHAALLFSLEPVSSAVFGFCFLHEVLSLRGYLGAVLVLCGVLIASVPQKKKDPAEAPDVL